MLKKIESFIEGIGILSSMFVVYYLFIFSGLDSTSLQKAYIYIFVLSIISIAIVLNKKFYTIMCNFLGVNIPYVIFIFTFSATLTYISLDISRDFGSFFLFFIVFIAVVSCIIYFLLWIGKVLQKLIDSSQYSKYAWIIYLVYLLLLFVLTIYFVYFIFEKGYYTQLFVYFTQLGWIQL